jgi:hypothetical protein
VLAGLQVVETVAPYTGIPGQRGGPVIVSIRGRIWVDTEDFAIARIEGQPAKNPSFWIRSVQVVQRYGRTDQFWLPAMNHSVAQARILGATEVVIEYSDYKTDVREVQARTRPEEKLHR